MCLVRGLAAGDLPPLVAEGEVIDDPERVIADIASRSAIMGIAFSPDGRLLARPRARNGPRRAPIAPFRLNFSTAISP